jgi:hypothetical protein
MIECISFIHATIYKGDCRALLAGEQGRDHAPERKLLGRQQLKTKLSSCILNVDIFSLFSALII